ncbi:MAG: ankyrin repeat domain-containing protein [Enterobacterales bacterium]|nr:ankyrin repeat domain-containing protein [Enterobacterales bacterium]
MIQVIKKWFVLLFLVITSCSANDSENDYSNIFSGDEVLISLAEVIDKNDIDCLKRLIGINGPETLNRTGLDGRTLLIWSIQHNKLDSFKVLLESGANPDVQMKNGDAAIHFASAKDSEYLKVLLMHGANPNLVTKKSKNEPAALYIAIGSFDIKKVEMLIAVDANVNQLSNHDYNPLAYAAALSQWEMVFKLIKAGADYKQGNEYGNSFLFTLENIIVDPGTKAFAWREKVIDFLKGEGVEIKVKTN